MMESEQRDEEGEWREVPAVIGDGAVQAAARSHLEGRGVGARQLEQRQRQRRQRAASKKPPLPPRTGCSGESACFGVVLEARQPRQLLEPLDGRGQGVWLPRVFVECVRVLRGSVESAGLFRKSGSLTRQRKLRTTLESGEGLMSPNVHDVASVLKQYLRELPSPLLPHTLTPSLEWAWSCEEVERVEMVMCVLLQLPQPHSQMVRELCQLLSSVADHHSQSLMDSHSLAVVMTPNIIPTHHSNPAILETTLSTGTGILQLMIDHAHLIGLAPIHVINHAHQLAKEGVASESSSESIEGGDGRKQKRSSVTDRVLGWGTKLMSTLGGGSREQDHASSLREDGGLQLGKPSVQQRLFEPSLPPHSRATPKTPRSGHKRHRSFLSARRHTDGRHGHRSLFSNPFRGPSIKGGEFARLGSSRFSERKFPWLHGHTPSTPGPGVQLVGFGLRSSLTGEQEENDGGSNEGGFPGNVVIGNHAAMTPVLGNSVLLASLSEESVRDGAANEGAEPPETYSVARKHSGKRMRCEVEGGGEEGRTIKRRHTIYTSHSRESLQEVGMAGIRTSKSATALGQTTSDPSTGFTFSRPTPQRTPKPHTPLSVAMETTKQGREVAMDTVAPPTSSGVPFTFSNPKLYVARKRVVSNSNGDEEVGRRRVCGASPIPRLPELPPRTPHDEGRGSSFATPGPRGQLNRGFLHTPAPPSPNLLQQINSELVDRYPLAPPLATPTSREAGLGMNESYRQAVYRRETLSLVQAASLQFSVTPDPQLGSEVMQEVSFSFQLNSPGCHGDTNKQPPSHGTSRVPLTPVHPVVSSNLPRLRPPLARKFALTPLLTPRPRFTDLSSPFTAPPLQKTAGKTPRVGRRAQMYVIPSSGSHGDKENMCGDVSTTEWVV